MPDGLAVRPSPRVLMTTDAVGGVWRYSVELAHGFAGLGAETVLAVLGPAASGAQRREAEGVAGLVEFREMDYRNLEGRFDRVVSVGMLEHVGIGYLGAYFAKVRSLLAEDGFAYIHSIGRMSPPGTTGHTRPRCGGRTGPGCWSRSAGGRSTTAAAGSGSRRTTT